jgi:predicted  nucleic acid-binding Zn-ribbon protein
MQVLQMMTLFSQLVYITAGLSFGLFAILRLALFPLEIKVDTNQILLDARLKNLGGQVTTLERQLTTANDRLSTVEWQLTALERQVADSHKLLVKMATELETK